MQAMKRDESIVVLDPKGELFDRFFTPLDNAGYTCIRRFDLAEPKEEWVGWNFIKSAGNTVESAYQVADTICDSINLPESYNIQTGARYLLSAIMLIANDCDEDDDMRSSVYILQDMLSSPDIAHNVRCFYQNNDGEVIDALGMVVRLSDADIEGTAYALMNGLRHMWNTDIMEILSSGDIDTALPANDKCAYFVQMPYDWNHPLDFMSALFFNDLLQNCFAEAAKTENGRCKVPVNIIFDDFSYAGNIANFARSISRQMQQISTSISSPTISAISSACIHTLGRISYLLAAYGYAPQLPIRKPHRLSSNACRRRSKLQSKPDT